MSMLKRPTLAWSIVALAVISIAVSGSLNAQTANGLSGYDGGPVAQMTENLPPVARGPMTVTQDPIKALSVLSFDDGTCEGGLGAGVTITDLVDFDVPTQCFQAGLDIVGLTARINTNTATAFAFAQSGATPPAAGGASTIALATGITGLGPCPATGGFATRAIGPGAAVITGTANFFAGLAGNSVYAGRDTNNPAGRIWLLCAGCGMTQYTPTTLSGLGLGGNWMIRVTVEDQNCLPVELMGFSVE
ncbi:MAG: hypothetical protein GY906_35755 [bacterium]|nr:hypothetical protein [bacterium]